MKRVTGIGGIFFKCEDPKATGEWYRRHLGVPVEEWGGWSFQWQDRDEPRRTGSTQWSPFPSSSKYFGASPKPFMFNFRVENLDAVLAALRAEGCAVDEKTDSSEYGKFGWVMDPDGVRIELWEPPASELKE